MDYGTDLSSMRNFLQYLWLAIVLLSYRVRGERLRNIRTMRGTLDAEMIIVFPCSRVCNIGIVVVVSVLLLVPKR